MSAIPRGILLSCVLSSSLFAQAVISEFSASNDLVLADFRGDHPDWLEIYNPGPGTIDLGGSYLTDNPLLLAKWQFPSPTLIAPGGFLVVFASDKDIANPGQELHTNFKLSSTSGYLALVDAAGTGVIDDYSPYPPQVGDVSYGHTFAPGLTLELGYFMTPTPGGPNGAAGAAVVGVTHLPLAPGDMDDIQVQAVINPQSGGAVTSAQLTYVVGFGSEQSTGMNDSGIFPDAIAMDGVWTGTISAAVSSPGQMVRWRVSATATGSGAAPRLPLYLSPTQSPRYFGAMISDPSVISSLDVFNWFVQNPSAARTRSGTRCSIWFGGEFYDNVFVRLRGNSSSGWPKKNFKFDFNRGHHFRFDPLEGRAEEINVNSTWSDKSFVRRILSWDHYRDAGVAGSLAEPWRLQQNGAFYSVAIFVEQPDEDMLQRNDLDPLGALYKMYNQLTSSSSGVRKATREWEGNADLQVLVSSVTTSGTTLETYLFDNVDLPAVGNYLAATSVMHDNDHVAKNYYVYRDSDGDGEWRFVPWDKDLTFGRNYTLGGGVLNDTMWSDRPLQSHPLFGDQGHQKIDNLWNRFIDACYRTPRVRQMAMRRLRTLMDTYLQLPGTPPATLHFEGRIDRLVLLMSADVALDQSRWGVPTWGSSSYTFMPAINQLENFYLAPRRNYMFFAHGPSGSGVVPAEQISTNVSFGAVERDPPSGIQDEEYIEIVNAASTAVDISEWRLEGGITFTFAPGTVIPALDSAFVSPHLPTFRARSTPPTGGQRLFVIGAYSGHINPAEEVRLVDPLGTVVDTIASLVQCGDCNGDGVVSIIDGLQAALHGTGFIALVDPEFASCNVNGVLGGSTVAGTTVDILDALDIARFSAVLLPTLPCAP